MALNKITMNHKLCRRLTARPPARPPACLLGCLALTTQPLVVRTVGRSDGRTGQTVAHMPVTHTRVGIIMYAPM